MAAEDVQANLIKNKENFSQVKEKYKNPDYKELNKSHKQKLITEAKRFSKTLESTEDKK